MLAAASTPNSTHSLIFTEAGGERQKDWAVSFHCVSPGLTRVTLLSVFELGNRGTNNIFDAITVLPKVGEHRVYLKIHQRIDN